MAENHGKEEIILEGVAASPGVVHGRALVYLNRELDVPCYDISESDVEGEIERFNQAILETRQEIMEIRNKIADSLGEGEARIFDAHLLVLEDSALLDKLMSEVREERKNIEFCYNKVANRYIQFFESMEDEYLKERVADIRDVSRRLLHNLIGMQKLHLSNLSEARIIVADDLSPSDTADLDRQKLLGVVTDWGGPTSHSVIMSRSLGIPSVVALHDATVKIRSGDEVLIDGHSGLVVIHPNEERLFQYGRLASVRRKLSEIYETVIPEPSETKDGKAVALMANIEGAQEIDSILRYRTDGVGLFRTEGIFLRHHGYPSESIQYEAYIKVIKAMGDKPVIIRTLDIGGDKVIDNLTPHEDNPFMGFRAIRFCLEHVDIFKTQLRAILRASVHGNVFIMYPMISGVGELLQANAILEEVKEDLLKQGEAFHPGIKIGSMIELPSAASVVDMIVQHSDFLSIGTNDLIQYLLAVDRLNDRVAHLYEPTHPSVLRTLKQIIDAGNAAKVPVGVCGEIAGDPIYGSLLIGMGVDSLSLAPSMLPEVKYFVRQIDHSSAQLLVDEVLQMQDPKQILKRLKDFHSSTMGSLLSAR